MATLSFKGKSFIQNYHLAVKYHELIPVKKKSLTDKVSLKDNLIIHGDNLKALKALLPTYAGKIKCIYIDPPYNTGDDGWAYNDNVNSPMMQEWLGQVVDKEDLTRHDKWLCMMMPRLRILRDLLDEMGILFVSIDDNEIYHLRMLLNEIFGEENFVNSIIWKKRYQGAKEKYLIAIHEYILLYAKNKELLSPFYIPISEELAERYYNNKDEKYKVRGGYRTQPLEAGKSMDTRENLVYPIRAPDGSMLSPKRQWVWGKDRVMKALENKELEFTEDKMGRWSVSIKQYLKDENGDLRYSKAFSIIDNIFTQHGTAELTSIFGDGNVFPFPKPSGLIKQLLTMGISDTESTYIVLDSFAGSGTTAHAVLDLNREDGGDRKFILVECEDYADRTTAERVRRVIKGTPKAKDDKLKKGLGGSFSYFELGKPIEMESILEGRNLPSYIDLARYVFYTATGDEFLPEKVNEDKHFIGASKEYEVYLFYKPDLEYLKSTALTLEVAKTLGKYKGKRKLVFAPTKYLDLNDSELLTKHGLKGIEYCQLPFEIYRLKE